MDGDVGADWQGEARVMMEDGPLSPRLSVWQLMTAITAAVPLVLTRRLRPLGLTSSQFTLLRVAAASTRPMTLGQLARALDQQPPATGETLDQLERQDWAQRVRDLPDRRAIRVELTAAGRAKLVEALSIEAGVIAAVFGRLTDADLATLRRLLERVGPDAADVPAGNPD